MKFAAVFALFTMAVSAVQTHSPKNYATVSAEIYDSEAIIDKLSSNNIIKLPTMRLKQKQIPHGLLNPGEVVPRFAQSQQAPYAPPPIYQMDEEGDEEKQLLGALRQIKTDIIAKSRQVRDDRRWVEQVRLVLKEYEVKMNRVVNHILLMRKEIKALYKKKKQIENLMLQRKLETKLKDASNDLSTLGTALDSVRTKEDTFQKNKNDVMETIDIIKSQLQKLKTGGMTTPGPNLEAADTVKLVAPAGAPAAGAPAPAPAPAF